MTVDCVLPVRYGRLVHRKVQRCWALLRRLRIVCPLWIAQSPDGKHHAASWPAPGNPCAANQKDATLKHAMQAGGGR